MNFKALGLLALTVLFVLVIVMKVAREDQCYQLLNTDNINQAIRYMPELAPDVCASLTHSHWYVFRKRSDGKCHAEDVR